MIERRPFPPPKRSLKSLEAGLALFPHFRKRLARRFVHPDFRIVLDLPGHSPGIGVFERASRRSISAIAASNWAKVLSGTASP